MSGIVLGARAYTTVNKTKLLLSRSLQSSGERQTIKKKYMDRDFPGSAVVKNPPANAGDTVQSLVREDPKCTE